MGGGGFEELGVVGDPVNVAARVQDATRELGVPLLLTREHAALLEQDPARLEARGKLALKGKAKPISVYGLAVS